MTQNVEADSEGGAFLIPAYNAGPLLAQVVDSLEDEKARRGLSHVPTVVVDDGCTDDSLHSLSGDRVTLLRHSNNRGKGAALLTGFRWAQDNQRTFLVTLDADDQHPAQEAVRLYLSESPLDHLLLGVRDLKAAGAPTPSQKSNAFSNWILSLFGGVELKDTQCGLRRYPVAPTLSLGASHPGYAYESELVLRAARTGLPIDHLDIRVSYPNESDRVSHFDSVRDPAKNVACVVKTTILVPHHRPLRRWAERLITLGLLIAGSLTIYRALM